MDLAYKVGQLEVGVGTLKQRGEKYNHNHDAKGEFASGPGGGGAGAAGDKKGGKKLSSSQQKAMGLLHTFGGITANASLANRNRVTFATLNSLEKLGLVKSTMVGPSGNKQWHYELVTKPQEHASHTLTASETRVKR
jgi:hypothetical protein